MNVLARVLPTSISGLMTIGCVVTAVPLLVALFLATSALERVTRLGENVVLDGVATTRLAMELRDGLIDLERNARQIEVLPSEQMRTVLVERLQSVHGTLLALDASGLGQRIRAPVSEVRERIDLARDRALLDDADAASPIAAPDVRKLVNVSERIIESGRRVIDDQTRELSQASMSARRVIWVSTLGLAPLAVILVFLAAAAIAGPVRRIGSGIQALGDGDYAARVSVSFPQEASELAGRLNWLGERLQQFEEDKDRFLRSVSHELKTPLASLREGSELLAREALGPLTPQQSEVAEILTESSSELESLIINLLTFAEWRAERRVEASDWFGIEPMLEEILRSRRLLLKRRNVKPLLQIETRKLYGQRARVREALDNLVGNAVRFAPAGTSLEIGSTTVDGQFELSVRDHGRGVDASEMEAIFEPFVRGAEAEEQGIRGTGIGLSIVREVARAHGGFVVVENAVPGARFRLIWRKPDDVETVE